jgi:hypothetical protein
MPQENRSDRAQQKIRELLGATVPLLLLRLPPVNFRYAPFATEIARRCTRQQREAATLLGVVRSGLPDPVQPHLLGRGRLDARGIARFLARLGARAEEGAALRRQLRPVADHAGFDALDIRNFGAAEPERVGSAGLLLLEGIGVTFARCHSCGESGGEQQCEPEPRMRYDRHRISPRSAQRKSVL